MTSTAFNHLLLDVSSGQKFQFCTKPQIPETQEYSMYVLNILYVVFVVCI